MSASATDKPIFEIDNLVVNYGHVEAVRGISLCLMPGQIISVIGPNGAGKTSLLSAAMGCCRRRVICAWTGNRWRAST